MNETGRADELRGRLAKMVPAGSLWIPEFSWGAGATALRIDGLVIDPVTRWVRGFELKTNRRDWMRDEKWSLYSQFCSSLTIVCPWELIKPEEIDAPLGLLWLGDAEAWDEEEALWKKRPGRFQKRDSLSWLWTYVKILETELPRAAARAGAAEKAVATLKEKKAAKAGRSSGSSAPESFAL